MSQEVHNTSPPDSGRSKISRDGSPSVTLGIPISGSENPSLQYTPGSPLSPPSPRASEKESIWMSIESKEKEVKEKQAEIKEKENKLDGISRKLENTDASVTEIEKVELRQEKLFQQTRLIQMGGEIQAMRQELLVIRELLSKRTPPVGRRTNNIPEKNFSQPLLAIVPSDGSAIKPHRVTAPAPMLKRSMILSREDSSPIEWKIDTNPQISKPFLNDDTMFFVNRERAALQLLAIHNSTYGKEARNSGRDWMYGICANDYGCGKSAFAQNYISLISNLEKESLTGGFKVVEVLKRAVTIHIRLENVTGRSLNLSEIDEQIVGLIKKQITEISAYPVDFQSFPQELISFMKHLLEFRSQQPIFLVLDEVADPFLDRREFPEQTPISQLKSFREFVGSRIQHLIKIKGLFLLLCGRAPFLDWIGAQPNGCLDFSTGSPLRTMRIVLNTIRPAKIVQILKNTFFVTPNKEEFSLQRFLNLQGSTDPLTETILGEYANQLYQISAGHPRTLIDILLKRCRMICGSDVAPPARHQIVSSDEGFLRSQDAEFLQETALKFSKATTTILESYRNNKHLRITDPVDGITYEHLLPPLRVGVEGDEINTTLCIPDRVLLLLEALVSPLFEYLRALETHRSVPIDFPFGFEVLVAKIFNHWFSTPKNPRMVNDIFFSAPAFGGWPTFACDNKTKNFPKVTSHSSRKDTSGPTIALDFANVGVEESFQQLPPNGLWLLPKSKSSSPDLIHISKSTEGTRRILCVAVKNYTAGSFLSTDDIEDEIIKAERMIPDKTYSSVLFIASTKYQKEIQKQLGSDGFRVHSSNKLGKIQEVILLNLTTPAWRSKVCGRNYPDGIPGFEILINKTQGDLGFYEVSGSDTMRSSDE